MRENQKNDPLSLYGGFLRQIIYEDRVKLEDFELIKLCKYYVAHVILFRLMTEKVFIEFRMARLA